jgi:DNA modification methylase
MKTELLSIDRITPYARNPRKNEGVPVSKVKASLKEFGWQQPIVVDKDMIIVVGHTRYAAALELGMKEVPVHIAKDLTPAQIKAYRIADNKTATFSEFDMELLALEFDDLKGMDFDLELTGFDDAELAGMDLAGEAATEGDTEPQTDRAEELREKWGVETGQLWALGEHRLLCGDSTKAEDVARVMGGGLADLVFADPPYGMRLDTNFAERPLTEKAKAKHPKQKNYAPVIGDEKDFDPRPVIEMFKDTKEQFWWGADYYRKYLPSGGSWIVWDKRKGIEDVEYTSAEFELCWSKENHSRIIIRVVWFGLCGTETQDVKTRIHPNQKPIQVCGEIIKKHSSESQIIFDPFSGSGTTIIACQNLKRKCRAIEISPAYTAVCLERFFQHTGITPTRHA